MKLSHCRGLERYQLLAPLLVSLVIAGAGRAADPEPLPTAADLHALYDNKEYQPLLLKIGRVLQLKGNPAKAYDRVELHLLRVDALLALKQSSAAIAAANEALKAIDDQTDEKLAAQARATAMLLKRMQGYAYMPKLTPKGKVPQPIDIVSREHRKEAFSALLIDMRADVTSKAKAAKAAKKMAPIIDAVRALADLRAVELTATDTDIDSRQLTEDIAGEAKDLMSTAVKDMKKRAHEIDADANNLVPNPTIRTSTTGFGDTAPQTYHKRGLTWENTKELKETIATCGKIYATAKDFEAVSKAMAEAFKDVEDVADSTAKAAKGTLEADYNGSYGK